MKFTREAIFLTFSRACRLLLLQLLLVSGGLAAQGGAQLIHAEVSRGRMAAGGERVMILEGAVHFRQDTVDIYCNRADHYRESGKIVLLGDVHIHRGKERLSAQKVTYYERRKLAIAERRVKVLRPGQSLASEYLEYYYSSDKAFARRNLLLTDESSGVQVTAERGEYIPQQHRSKVWDNAHFRQIDAGGGDTLHIHAEVMEYFFQPQRRATASDSVRIRRGDLTAECDSASYLLSEERVFLERNPRARQQGNRLTGRQMEMDFAGNKLRRIRVNGEAVAVSVEDSSAGKMNRLTGQGITAFVVENKLSELWAYDNARSKYYLKDNGISQGINTASADTIRIYFREGELDRIAVKGGSQGIYYPTGYQGKIDTEY